MDLIIFFFTSQVNLGEQLNDGLKILFDLIIWSTCHQELELVSWRR